MTFSCNVLFSYLLDNDATLASLMKHFLLEHKHERTVDLLYIGFGMSS